MIETPFHCSCGAARVETIRSANALIREQLKGDPTRFFVDAAMENPRIAEIDSVLADMHHLNNKGHEMLGKVLGPVIITAYQRSCRAWEGNDE